MKLIKLIQHIQELGPMNQFNPKKLQELEIKFEREDGTLYSILNIDVMVAVVEGVKHFIVIRGTEDDS